MEHCKYDEFIKSLLDIDEDFTYTYDRRDEYHTIQHHNVEIVTHSEHYGGIFSIQVEFIDDDGNKYDCDCICFHEYDAKETIKQKTIEFLKKWKICKN